MKSCHLYSIFLIIDAIITTFRSLCPPAFFRCLVGPDSLLGGFEMNSLIYGDRVYSRDISFCALFNTAQLLRDIFPLSRTLHYSLRGLNPPLLSPNSLNSGLIHDESSFVIASRFASFLERGLDSPSRWGRIAWRSKGRSIHLAWNEVNA